MLGEGPEADVVAAYVRSQHLSAPLTAEEIIDWKKAGIPQQVMRAALPDKKDGRYRYRRLGLARTAPRLAFFPRNAL
jgi:hypothetical protein